MTWFVDLAARGKHYRYEVPQGTGFPNTIVTDEDKKAYLKYLQFQHRFENKEAYALVRRVEVSSSGELSPEKKEALYTALKTALLCTTFGFALYFSSSESHDRKPATLVAESLVFGSIIAGFVYIARAAPTPDHERTIRDLKYQLSILQAEKEQTDAISMEFSQTFADQVCALCEGIDKLIGKLDDTKQKSKIQNQVLLQAADKIRTVIAERDSLLAEVARLKVLVPSISSEESQ